MDPKDEERVWVARKIKTKTKNMLVSQVVL